MPTKLQNEHIIIMEYQVLARKWRPQKFADVIGQDYITQTLQSELMQDKTAHAYLFVGPRGIGKTTIARIFAKAMNCKNAPVKEPCCQCESCLAIAEGSSLDLIEIDGASNNSVDDIRQLREEVLYSPVSSRFKIYIIDEVHMLSTNAWNALLKTIEEPPQHAKFLFATTEAHKVLPTVVSRCQRFDLQRITFKLIMEQLKRIALAENVTISDSAIEVIARAADGGMRDAQSLLDQIIAFSLADQGEISEEEVLSVFGLTGVKEMERLVLAIVQNDASTLISAIHQIAGHGKNLEKLYDDILSFLRGVHICMIMDNPENILETGDDMIALYRKIASVSNPGMIQKVLENLSPVARILHDAINKQVFLETVILKAMRVAHSVEIRTLIERLNQIRNSGELAILEEMPSIVKNPPVTDPADTKPSVPTVEKPLSSAPLSAPAATPVEPVSTPPPAEAAPAAVTPSVASAPATSAPAVVPPSVPEEKKPDVPEVSSVIPENPLPEQPPVQPVAQSLSPEKQPSLQSIPEKDAVLPQFPEPVESAAVQSAVAPDNGSAPEDDSDSSVHLLQNPKDTGSADSQNGDAEAAELKPDNSQQTPEAVWHAAIKEMGYSKQPLLKAYMQMGRPESFVNGEFTVLYDDDSSPVYVAELKKQHALVETCLRRASNNNQVALNIIEKKGVESPHESAHRNSEDLADVKRRAEKNPFVKDVIDMFDGSIVDVKG